LKGVGDYTAAAICSIAYNMPYAVVDGNVYRVLSRVFGITTPIDSMGGKKQYTALAQALLDKKNPGDYNQAIMDFGATCCTPKIPQCKICPMKKFCTAYKKGLQDVLPVKTQKTKISARYFHYIYVEQGKFTWLHKRGAGDVWQNLYEPPLVETPTEKRDASARAQLKKWFGSSRVVTVGKPIKHVLSHRIIYAHIYKVVLPPTRKVPAEFLRVPVKDLPQYAVSRLVQKLLEKM
ncbi:MAG: NUDIX domain-containing protein, partial [Elusimicrobiaceae bacterium]|nr:NUDIX domain-containing protein [Elusimicrobiaceae bacterium]